MAYMLLKVFLEAHAYNKSIEHMYAYTHTYMYTLGNKNVLLGI